MHCPNPQPGLRVATNDAKLVVLLVDDDPDCRMLVRDSIESSGIDPNNLDVHEAASGEEALAFLESVDDAHPRPNLIYMDMEMPGIGGMETLRRIKASENLKQIPIVMLTGVASDLAMKRAAAFGANSYTVKPADAERLIETVLASSDYWLRVHQAPGHHLPQEQARR
ncbi:MAG: response regulator [Planctomycetota bacterium]